jgi:hypothetical protein
MKANETSNADGMDDGDGLDALPGGHFYLGPMVFFRINF